MTYRKKELSHDSGQPVELFDFYQGTIHWRYTNADRVINFDGFDWEPIAIKRDEISQTPEMARIGLKITAQRTCAVYERFRVAPPGSVVGCTVYSIHYNDASLQAIPEWTGRILGCVRKDSEVTFSGEPVYVSMKTNGLRRCWQKQCPHLLYGPGCKVVKESFQVDAEVQLITGLTVQLDAAILYPDYYFEGGYMEWEDSLGLPLRRDIMIHVGGEVTLGYTLHDLALGQSVKLFPGCDHTMIMCDERYDNILNYGGTPYIPKKNPYSGNPVY